MKTEDGRVIVRDALVLALERVTRRMKDLAIEIAYDDARSPSLALEFQILLNEAELIWKRILARPRANMPN